MKGLPNVALCCERCVWLERAPPTHQRVSLANPAGSLEASFIRALNATSDCDVADYYTHRLFLQTGTYTNGLDAFRGVPYVGQVGLARFYGRDHEMTSLLSHRSFVIWRERKD